MAAQQYFAEVSGALGSPCGNGCYTSYLRVTDIDGDGDLDILMPNGNFESEPFVLYLNDGSGDFTDASASVVGGYSAALRQIAVGDVDADGDLDVHAPSANGGADAFFINQGGGVLLDQADRHLPGVHSRSEGPPSPPPRARPRAAGRARRARPRVRCVVAAAGEDRDRRVDDHTNENLRSSPPKNVTTSTSPIRRTPGRPPRPGRGAPAHFPCVRANSGACRPRTSS